MSNNTNIEYMEMLLKYKPLIILHTSKIINDSVYFEDVVQEVWVNLFNKIEIIKEFNEGRLATYIINTTRHTAINYKTKSDREDRRKYNVTMEYTYIPDTSQSPDEIVLANEENAIIKEKLDMLPERDRDMLVCKYYMDMDARSMAEIFNMKVKDIHTYMHLAREKLKKVL